MGYETLEMDEVYPSSQGNRLLGSSESDPGVLIYENVTIRVIIVLYYLWRDLSHIQIFRFS